MFDNKEDLKQSILKILQGFDGSLWRFLSISLGLGCKRGGECQFLLLLKDFLNYYYNFWKSSIFFLNTLELLASFQNAIHKVETAVASNTVLFTFFSLHIFLDLFSNCEPGYNSVADKSYSHLLVQIPVLFSK